jgi:hypothetical protein
LYLPAQVSANCSSATITSQGDADRFRACATITGGVTIASSAVGDIRLDGVELILDDFSNDVCDTYWCSSGNGTEVTSLSSSTLIDISGGFILQSLPWLNTLSFPRLNRVAGISWKDLPNLSNVSLEDGITSLHGNSDDITIEDADKLISLQGLNFKNLITMTINLTNLAKFSLPVQNARQIRIYGGNSLDLNLSSLAGVDLLELTGCAKVTLQNLNAMPILSLHDNSFESFTLPAVNSTYFSSIVVENNIFLRRISFSPLDEIVSLQVLKNPLLSSINLPNLENLYNVVIDGALAR